MEFSNRSFDIEGDGWTRKQKDTAERSLRIYTEGQSKKRVLYQDRKQWRNYRSVLGDDAYKSFANFRRMKYNNSEKWSGLQRQYKTTIQSNWEQSTLSRFSEVDSYRIFKKADEIPKWAHDQIFNWSDGEKADLTYYTSHNFSKINDCLRGSTSAGAGIRDRIANISSAIAKSDIGENVVLWRGASLSNFEQADWLRKTPADKWIGQSISDKAFSSTSMLE